MNCYSRRLILLPAIAAWAALDLLTASAVIPVGNGRIVGTAGARADYDSNIFVSNSEVDDVVGTFDAGVRYVRDASLVTLEASAGLTAFVFADHDEQNSVDPYVSGILGYTPSEKTDFRGSAGYRRSTIANEAVNARTESDDLNLDGSLQQLFSEKLGFRAVGNYAGSEYRTAGYSDVFNYGFGVHAVHVYSPKLTLLAGITRAEWWTERRAPGRRSAASRDWRYTLGFEGEIAPKVTGDIDIGFVQRDFKLTGFRDTSSLYLGARLMWAAAEKTTYTLALNRDLSVSAADQAVRSFNATLTLSQVLSEKVSLETSVGYSHSNYESFGSTGLRSDDGYTLRGRLNFAIRENLTADVSAGYRDNSSNIAVSDYSRVNIGAGITLRF